MHDERRSAAEDRVVAIESVYRVAEMAALLEAHDVGIAKIPASRTLQQIAADRPEVANLRRRRFAGRLGHRREARAHERMLPQPRSSSASAPRRNPPPGIESIPCSSVSPLRSTNVRGAASCCLSRSSVSTPPAIAICPGCASKRTAAGKSAGVTISKRFTLSDRPSNFSQRRQYAIGRDREIAYRHADRVVHRASDRRG